MNTHARTPCCQPANNAGLRCEPADDAGLCAPALVQAAQGLRALADPTRLEIVQQLRERDEVCACDFVACCAVAQPTVSHHLRVLREAGLVRTEKRGQWVYYRLDEERLAEIGRLLLAR